MVLDNTTTLFDSGSNPTKLAKPGVPPSCVTFTTAESLEERGWGTILDEIMKTQTQCEIPNGLWGIWYNAPSVTSSCNLSTQDAGK